MSVCPYPEKRNRLNFVNISPTLVIDNYINEKVFTSTTYNMEPKKFDFSKVEIGFDLICIPVSSFSCRYSTIKLMNLLPPQSDDRD